MIQCNMILDCILYAVWLMEWWLHDNNNYIEYVTMNKKIFIGSYIIVLLISGVNPRVCVFWEKCYEWWYGILESRLVTLLISFFGNLWKRNMSLTLLSSLTYPQLLTSLDRNVQLYSCPAMSYVTFEYLLVL